MRWEMYVTPIFLRTPLSSRMAPSTWRNRCDAPLHFRSCDRALEIAEGLRGCGVNTIRDWSRSNFFKFETIVSVRRI